ncbi:hypothetical protein HOD96_01670 [Candidatus Falkowbacteria bacterium]|jgi:Leucine-rich repeat (LRR) protein|nr:hypothetical protein [Candidatus Falkowbacteria bacterium]MBT4433327.1 hypothetical protein [Candidatus Falkowbacteria bacterium]
MKKTFFLTIVISLLLSGCTLSVEQESVNVDKENIINNEPVPGNEQPLEKKTQTKDSLNLSNQNLQKIPEYVFGRTNLEELNVSGNKLTGAIQAEIRHLQKLKILNASNNFMTGVPAEIGQLQNLEILNLSNNQLTGLPYELGNLKNLKIFNISGNNYSELDLSIIQEKLPKNVNIIK